MTRKPVPRKKPAAKVRGKSAPKRSAKTASTRAKGHPLDPLIDASARALKMPVRAAWKPAIRQHLDITLRQAALLEGFALPDEADPAPVFQA